MSLTTYHCMSNFLSQTDEIKRKLFIEAIRKSVSDILDMKPQLFRKKFIYMVRILDRAGVKDQQVIEKIVNHVAKINAFEKLIASDIRLLLTFFRKH